MKSSTDDITFDSSKFSYTLKNIVPKQILSVTGLTGGVVYTFKQSTDYGLIGNSIVWGATSASTLPDNNSEFEVIYNYDPILTPIEFTKEQYGRDMKLFGDDIRGDASGEVDIDKFQSNLLDSLRHRLLTDVGELYKHPNYGSELYKLLGERINQNTIELAKLYVISCINQDPRVGEIVDVVVTPNYTTRALKIDVTFIPIGTNEPLNLVYDFFVDKTEEGYIYQ